MDLTNALNKSQKYVDILCYCLMPNHFHFLLRQNLDNGISKFIANIENSYTKYINKKMDRDGSMFLDQFKSVLIEKDETLIHVSRYIHLNPYTSSIVSTLEKNIIYPWNSLSEYIGVDNQYICNKDIINQYFKHKKHSYLKFVNNHADFQKKLSTIKHLMFDD